MDAPPVLPPLIVYTDFDGTLLGRGASLLRTTSGEPTDDAARSLVELYRAGARVVPVSGRNAAQLLEASRLLAFEDFICELGSEIVYGLGAESEVVALDFVPDPPPDGTPLAAHLRAIGLEDELLRAFDGTLEPHTPWAAGRRHTLLYRGLATLPDGRDLPAAVTDFLEGRGYGWLTFFDNGPVARRGGLRHDGEVRAYHLLPRGVNKAVAVRRHRSRFPGARTYAFGNSAADLAMASEVDAFYFFGDERELSRAATALAEACNRESLAITVDGREAVINGHRVLAIGERGPAGFRVATRLALSDDEPFEPRKEE